jgi:CRISPR-associated endonuclease Cas2
LRAMHKLAKAYGDPIQYSVFSCLLRPTDRARLAERIEALIDRKLDRVVLIDIGAVADRETWIPPIESFGRQQIRKDDKAIIA